MDPKVSFIIPCFKLGHLLTDCVSSILSQTYGDFELIIMDDCSPDRTPDVVKSFLDARVRYVRNEKNLGVCRNFNKGIMLAKGAYIWILSADDRLRRDYALARFVEFMDKQPTVGFAFCPTMWLEGNQETIVQDRIRHGTEDRVFRGDAFFRKLQRSFCLSPSAIVRRDCYFGLGLLPEDLDYAGDWYLWCLFALHHDVGYLAEPMVHQRIHAGQITQVMNQGVPQLCRDMYIAARWRVKAQARAAGRRSLERACLEGIASDYIGRLGARVCRSSPLGMTLQEFEQSLRQNGAEECDGKQLRAWMYHAAGDLHYSRREFDKARECYGMALKQQWWNVKGCAKYALLSLGQTGLQVRAWLAAVSQHKGG